MGFIWRFIFEYHFLKIKLSVFSLPILRCSAPGTNTQCIAITVPKKLTHALTYEYSRAHSLTHSLTHPLTESATDRLMRVTKSLVTHARSCSFLLFAIRVFACALEWEVVTIWFHVSYPISRSNSGRRLTLFILCCVWRLYYVRFSTKNLHHHD